MGQCLERHPHPPEGDVACAGPESNRCARMPTAFGLVVLAHCLDYCRIGVRRVEIIRSTTSGSGAIKIASLGAIFSFIGFSYVPRSRVTLSAILTADLRF